MIGGDGPDDVDVEVTVVVPSRPGPLVRLAGSVGTRDEVDDVLDDVFGAPDDGGAGAFDLVLLLGGLAAVAAGATSLAPRWVLVAGVLSAGLGLVLPVRSLWRRRAATRRAARLRTVIGDGTLLRTDHPALAALVSAHDRCLDATTGLVAWRRVQVGAVTHAAVTEVSTLLTGRVPADAEEVAYVAARSAALDELADALGDPSIGDGDDAGRRRAVLDARVELDATAGSAVHDARSLTRALRDDP